MTPFVGRLRELQELDGGLESAVAGRGRLILVSGEPGIGKTRLCEELVDWAAARGVRVAWARERAELDWWVAQARATLEQDLIDE